MNHRAFFVRVIHDGTDAAKYRGKDAEGDCRVAFGSRNENGSRRYSSRTVKRVTVAIAEEQDEIERAACDIVDERSTRRPLAFEPGQFIGSRMRVLEDAV